MMNQRMISLTLAGVFACAGLGIATDASARDGQWRGSHGSHQGHGQEHGRHEHRGGGHRQARHEPRRHRPSYQHHHRPPERRHGPPPRSHRPVYGPPVHYTRHYRYRAPSYYAPPPGYRSVRWSRGHYLPRPYYAPVYVVDYRPYRLAPPPYGHHWVRVDNDVLLIALATGLIVDVMYGLFY